MKKLILALAVLLLVGCSPTSETPNFTKHGNEMFQEGFDIGVNCAMIAQDQLGHNANPETVRAKAKEIFNDLHTKNNLRYLPLL